MIESESDVKGQSQSQSQGGGRCDTRPRPLAPPTLEQLTAMWLGVVNGQSTTPKGQYIFRLLMFTKVVSIGVDDSGFTSGGDAVAVATRQPLHVTLAFSYPIDLARSKRDDRVKDAAQEGLSCQLGRAWDVQVNFVGANLTVPGSAPGGGEEL